MSDQEFAALIEEIRGGSEEAILRLVESYGHHVYRSVRQHLNRRLRSKFDSGDFVQAVWASFFESRERLHEFATADDLVRFLTRVARNKVIDECRRRLILKGRNVNREIALDRSDIGPALVSREPTASALIVADERYRRLISGEPSHYRRIIELKRDGATHVEIAMALGVNAKTVQRVLRRLERGAVR